MNVKLGSIIFFMIFALSSKASELVSHWTESDKVYYVIGSQMSEGEGFLYSRFEQQIISGKMILFLWPHDSNGKNKLVDEGVIQDAMPVEYFKRWLTNNLEVIVENEKDLPRIVRIRMDLVKELWAEVLVTIKNNPCLIVSVPAESRCLANHLEDKLESSALVEDLCDLFMKFNLSCARTNLAYEDVFFLEAYVGEMWESIEGSPDIALRSGALVVVLELEPMSNE